MRLLVIFAAIATAMVVAGRWITAPLRAHPAQGLPARSWAPAIALLVGSLSALGVAVSMLP